MQFGLIRKALNFIQTTLHYLYYIDNARPSVFELNNLFKEHISY
ncbi:hypothetical protein V202x_42820 [Gimesia aquarii]|uniref:Uncharacterized protein n=1 Tax=Gimesia aquarii TaxID=2527964 RepID=A0A517X033_9PLAN|nr:hypothetical protein V202x_42820 [Gimesia aquarii]